MALLGKRYFFLTGLNEKASGVLWFFLINLENYKGFCCFCRQGCGLTKLRVRVRTQRPVRKVFGYEGDSRLLRELFLKCLPGNVEVAGRLIFVSMG